MFSEGALKRGTLYGLSPDFSLRFALRARFYPIAALRSDDQGVLHQREDILTETRKALLI